MAPRSITAMIFLYIIIICKVLLIEINAIDIECNEITERKMDRAITKLVVVGQRNLRFPETGPQLRQYCNFAMKTMDMGKVFSDKCLPPFGREASKIIMHAIRVEMNIICRTGRLTRKARELLEAAPCGNAGLKNWKKCNDDFIDKLTGTNNAIIKQRLPMSCCNFHHFIDCLTNEAEEVKRCTKKTVDFLVKYMHKIVDQFLVFLCPEYSEPSDKCDRMVSLTPNRTEEQPIYKSFLMPIIDIAYGIGDEVFA